MKFLKGDKSASLTLSAECVILSDLALSVNSDKTFSDKLKKANKTEPSSRTRAGLWRKIVMGKQITIIARLKAKPGFESRLEEAAKSLVEPTRAEEGCIKYVLYRDLEDSAVYYFYEDWRSEEDLDRHLKTPHVSRVLEIAPEILAEPLGIIRLEMLA